MKMSFRKIRAEKISQILSSFLKKGNKILDVGSGTCIIAKQLKKDHRIDITCVDVKDYNKTDLPLILCKPDKLPFPDKSFDAALLIYVLHHSRNSQELIKEAARISKKDVIVMEDIYSNSLDHLLISFIDLLWNIWHPVSTPFLFLKKDEWLSTFNQLNLKVKKEHIFRFHFLDPVKHILFVLSS